MAPSTTQQTLTPVIQGVRISHGRTRCYSSVHGIIHLFFTIFSVEYSCISPSRILQEDCREWGSLTNGEANMDQLDSNEICKPQGVVTWQHLSHDRGIYSAAL
jgi:hypothetical protein